MMRKENKEFKSNVSKLVKFEKGDYKKDEKPDEKRPKSLRSLRTNSEKRHSMLMTERFMKSSAGRCSISIISTLITLFALDFIK